MTSPEPDDPRPLLAGVMGWPVAHSRSPLIFAHWFARHAVPGAYVRLAVRPGDAAEVLRALPKAGFRGLNVTIPHKLAALELADEASQAARAIGAANTLVFGPDGRVRADNTDAFGFLESLREAAPAWRPDAGLALVLGAGGAARAVVHALLGAGLPAIRLANRSRPNADALAAHFGDRLTPLDWAARDAAVADAALIVNATSLGMRGQPPLALGLDTAAPGTVVADLVYTPLITKLLADARARGLGVVDGIGMLLHQARPGFRAWFGHDPAVDPALRGAVLEEER
ncbi:MAG TPA: shikimate dehydrogenase [Thermohalobaculum sp.]|nr:shikimate dehydrogenase [Thermohalobaculum sp.]